MPATWMVRAGRGGEYAEDFVQKGIVAIGWHELGQISMSTSREALAQKIAEAYPDSKDGSRLSSLSTVSKFVSALQVGDTVVTYDRDRRLYLTGSITSAHEWRPDLLNERMPNVRKIRWTGQVPRDVLTPASRNTLGSIATIFSINGDVAAEVRAKEAPIGSAVPEVLSVPASSESPPAQQEADLRAEVVERADEFIEDAISRLDWKQMQELVAGILRSMGYRTVVSGPGADRGVDIFASPDGLGLQEPRIFVEVKHRFESRMGAPEIRSFLGGRKPGDKCLYVSTGGFAKDAQYEAQRSTIPLTLITLSDLRKLLVDHYEQIDAETRALVPLKRLYWPVG